MSVLSETVTKIFRSILFVSAFLVVDLNGQLHAAMKSVTDSLDTKYGTLNFEIHSFEDRHKDMAIISEILKSQNSIKLIEYFKYVPKSPVHIFLDGRSLTANGYAQPIPHNFIYLFDFSPLDKSSLAANENWLEVLVLHELTHILHMDQTEGWMDRFRSVFGSIVKPGGLVPRWFSEGIAVWAESEFTSQGRLKSGEIKNFVYHKLKSSLDKNYCNNLGCLDNPGTYPFGSYPYWVGGFLIEYLHKEKGPETVNCLIKTNARKIPFFLNDVFRSCIEDKNANEVWLDFKNQFVSDYEKENNIIGQVAPSVTAKPNSRALVHPFPVSVVKDGKLFFLFYENQMQYLGIVDLETKEREEMVMGDRVDMISLINNEIYLKAYVGLDERGKRRIYKLKQAPKSDSSNKGNPYILEEVFTNTKAYSFPKGNKSIDAQYKDFRWKLKFGEQELELPRRYWLSDVSYFNETLFFKVFQNGKKGNILAYWDLAKNELIKIDEIGENNSIIIGSCGPYLTYTSEPENDSKSRFLKLFEPDKKRISTNRFKNLLNASQGDGKTQMVFTNKEEFKTCESLFKNGQKTEVTNRKNNKLLLDDVWGEVVTSKDDLEFYPKVSHMLPQYWYLFYGQAGNLDFALARTLISDPRGINNFDLGVNYYPDNNLWAPQLSYRWAPRYFYIAAIMQENYTQSSFDNSINNNEYLGAYIGKQFVWENWLYSGQVEALDAKENDFISRRDSDVYSFSQVFQYVKDRKFQFFDNFYLRSRVSHYRNKGNFESFWGFQSRAGLGFNLSNDLNLTFTGGYSRFFKDDFLSGVAFGGGVSANAVNSTFSFNDFHGIQYTDIFGNLIYSYGAEFYYTLARPFKGFGLFPVQFNELGPLIGTEYIRADRIILDNRLKANSYAHSIYGGLRSNLRAFYLSDINVDYLFTFVSDSEDSEFGQLLLVSSIF